MAVLLRSALSGYSYLFDDLADYRTRGWLFVDSPLPVAAILVAYLLFVYKIGPDFMMNRKPFNIDWLLIVYNAFQVLLSAYTFLWLCPHVFSANLLCFEIDYNEFDIPHIAFVYHWTKITDLLDTVFFVLRKKNNQVSFLHVYHHTIMVAYTWLCVKYVSGGQLTFLAFANTFVHTVMYFYYLLTAYDQKYKRSVWWKKHITQLQLAQFALVTAWMLAPMMQPSCKYASSISMVVLPQVLTITVLFADFYYKNYIKAKPAEKSA